MYRAVANAMRNGRTFLMNKGFSEDEAFTMMSVACDFGITQVIYIYLYTNMYIYIIYIYIHIFQYMYIYGCIDIDIDIDVDYRYR